jgi:hypothetical protein
MWSYRRSLPSKPLRTSRARDGSIESSDLYTAGWTLGFEPQLDLIVLSGRIDEDPGSDRWRLPNYREIGAVGQDEDAGLGGKRTN